ncbi:hypothetical protein Q5P01_003752 [Channa striata]|uniref:Uncharacterized protein n=1 Tax=Channa striata TaxID=64152 RepID=A0AA88NI88_CHASR|nr:hypothetical protein Q5P01_003752 [Channa striata]
MLGWRAAPVDTVVFYRLFKASRAEKSKPPPPLRLPPLFPLKEKGQSVCVLQWLLVTQKLFPASGNLITSNCFAKGCIIARSRGGY